MWGGSIMRVIFRGRRSIWWSWRVTLVAPRIVNDVSNVRRINHEIHFSCQGQYLVKLEGDSCSSAHCKWRFICDTGQSWDSFCVAGAVFGEVGGPQSTPPSYKVIKMSENRGVENSREENRGVENSRQGKRGVENRGVENSREENRGVETSQVEKRIEE